MGYKPCFKLLLTAAALAITAACGGGSTFNVQNPPPPVVSNPLTITFQPTPPTSVMVNSTAQATAVIQNDNSSAGVDWSLTCPQAGKCGSLSSLHTSSGQAVTYTPPAIIFGNSQVVSVTAFATADHTKNVQGRITVTAFGTVLGGTYVIGTSGSDFSGMPYQRAGVLTLDGNGGIVSGERTVNFFDPNTGLPSSVTDPVTGGSYFVGPDGRGELVISTNNSNIGQSGTETFSLVVLSTSHVLLTKLDDVSFQGASNEASVGTLDLQTSASAPSLGYAFVANGIDVNGSAMALGGVLNVDSPQAISGAGSAFDLSNPGILGPGVLVPSSTVSGTLTTPDAFGAYQIAVVTDFANPVQFTAYPIDATHAKLIESDGSFGFTAGDAYSQGAATGTYHGKAKFNGNYVLEIFGRDLGGGVASLAAAGRFSTTGTGTLTSGFLDESQTANLIQIDDKFTAAYAVGPGSDPTVTTDPAGTGRYYIPISGQTGFPKFTFGTPSNGSGPAWVFYMTTIGGPALMLDADIEPSLASGLFGGGVGTGIAYPVVPKSSFSGLYGTIFTQNQMGIEVDVVGEIAASNNAISSGVLDFNSASGPQQDDTSLTGTFTTGTVPNRLGGTMSDTFFANALGTTTLRMVLYPIDPTQGFLVEHDVANSAGSPVSGDLTVGYYSARTPVCQGCP